MTPIPEWRRFLRRAWSVRFHAASVVLCSAGGAMMLVNAADTGHPLAWAAGVFFCSAVGGVLGIIAQVTRQKNLDGANG